MHADNTTGWLTEECSLLSVFLERTVTISCFLPLQSLAMPTDLLLMNDGQQATALGLGTLLQNLLKTAEIMPLSCIAIHASEDRKMEYGTARCANYQGLGKKAAAYGRFILEELLPFVQMKYALPAFKSKSFAGFSLGGLSALDMVWNHPAEFSRAGVFSGSLWWRTRALHDGYNENTDRIMHRQVKQGGYYPWLKFFFEAGGLDETMDRNHNGIIDSIDDTLALIGDLVAKGYHPQKDIQYLELPDGRHDIATWARALPVFLKWGWGRLK